jgi:hypothetical protein
VSDREHLLVRNGQSIEAPFANRQNVVTELPQDFDGWIGKVFVPEEAGQRLCLLVLAELPLDLLDMASNK